MHRGLDSGLGKHNSCYNSPVLRFKNSRQRASCNVIVVDVVDTQGFLRRLEGHGRESHGGK